MNRLLFMKSFVGQQTDLEQYSKFYWLPMKGTKQWNTASERRCVCCNADQLILNALKFGEVNVRDTMQEGIAIIETTRQKSSCKSFCTI